jgi:hypothetical protein
MILTPMDFFSIQNEEAVTQPAAKQFEEAVGR